MPPTPTAARRIALALPPGLGYARALMQGVRQYLDRRPGWICRNFNLAARLPQAIRAWRPEGILGLFSTPDRLRAFRAMRLPLVNVSGGLIDAGVPTVCIDERAAGALAAEHFLQRGLRRLAFIGMNHASLDARREQAFVRRLAVEGLSVDRFDWAHPALADGAIASRRADEVRRRWLRGLPKPVGVFAANDVTALRLIENCQEARLQVPEEVAILGMDDDESICLFADPPLSSLRPAADMIGYRAAEMLDGLLAGKDPPRRPIEIPPRGVTSRQSTDMLAIDDPSIRAAVKFIHDHLDQQITVESVMETQTVSRPTFEKRFKSAVGRTPRAEIRRIQIERAKALLAETDLVMPRVAEAAGFRSAVHLSMIFRRLLGQTPTEYRNRFRLR